LKEKILPVSKPIPILGDVLAKNSSFQAIVDSLNR
jgi:hypothetical protein